MCKELLDEKVIDNYERLAERCKEYHDTWVKGGSSDEEEEKGRTQRKMMKKKKKIPALGFHVSSKNGRTKQDRENSD